MPFRIGGGRFGVNYERVFEPVKPGKQQVYELTFALKANYIERKGNRAYAIFDVEKTDLPGVPETSLYFRVRLPSQAWGRSVELKMRYVKLHEPDPKTGMNIDILQAKVLRFA